MNGLINGIVGGIVNGRVDTLGSLLNQNAFNVSLLKYGALDSNTGAFVGDSDQFIHCDYIECNTGDAIRINYFNSLMYGTISSLDVFFFSANKTFISKVTNSTGNDNFTYTAPTNAKYFRFRTDVILYTPNPSLEYVINAWNLKVYINKELPSDALSREQLSSKHTNVIHVADYVDGIKSDSEIIDLAIADLVSNGTLVFGEKNYLINKAIELPSNTTTVINHCRIKQVNETFDNIFRGANLVVDAENPYGYLTSVNAAENISIIGYGNARLNGCDVSKQGVHPVLGVQNMVGDNWGWRTNMLSFSDTSNITIKNIAIANGKGWAVAFDYCNGLNIDKLCIYNSAKNGDGINLREGCKNVNFKNIYANCTDDIVALNNGSANMVFPSGNYLYPFSPASQKYINQSSSIKSIENITGSAIRGRSSYHNLIFLSGEFEIRQVDIRYIVCYLSKSTNRNIYFYSGTANKITATISGVSANEDFAIYLDVDVSELILNNVTNRKAGGAIVGASNAAYLTDVAVST